MSKYFMIYLALVCFAASLAVADEIHKGESAKASGREVVTESDTTEQSVEGEKSDAFSLIQALEEAEKGLGKRRSTGEVSEVTTE